MEEKDYKRAERLDKVFKHLFVHYGIETQTAMADCLEVSRTGLSAAFNGNKRNLTNNLFKKICAKFPGVFNLNYLLKGEGELLASPAPSDKNDKATEMDGIGESGMRNLFDIAMDVIMKNEALNRQLVASIKELRSLIDRYGPIIKYEQSSEKAIHQYADMDAEDRGFVEVK